MPSLRILSFGGLPILSVDETLGLPWKVLADGVLFKSGTGDDSFRIDSLSPGQHTMTLDVVSFPLTRLTITISQALPPPPVLPPPPPPPPQGTDTGDYEVIGSSGPRCTMLKKSIGAGVFFFLKNNVTGELSSGATTIPALISGGWRTRFQCDAPLPPTPQQWQQSVSDALGRFYQGVTGALGDMTSGLAAVRKDLDGIWDKLEAWLVERILGIIWKALTQEKKED